MKISALALLLLTSASLNEAAPVRSALGQDHGHVQNVRSSSVVTNPGFKSGSPISVAPLDLSTRDSDAQSIPTPVFGPAHQSGSKTLQTGVVLLRSGGPRPFDLSSPHDHLELSKRSTETRLGIHGRGLFSSIGKIFSGPLAKKVLKWAGWASIAVTIADALHIHLNPTIGDQDGGSSSGGSSKSPSGTIADALHMHVDPSIDPQQ